MSQGNFEELQEFGIFYLGNCLFMKYMINGRATHRKYVLRLKYSNIKLFLIIESKVLDLCCCIQLLLHFAPASSRTFDNCGNYHHRVCVCFSQPSTLLRCRAWIFHDIFASRTTSKGCTNCCWSVRISRVEEESVSKHCSQLNDVADSIEQVSGGSKRGAGYAY